MKMHTISCVLEASPRVRVLPRGTLGIPMPQMRVGSIGRKLPGGMPPEPYRARNDWNSGSRFAHSDGTSKACRGECAMSQRLCWDGVKGKWVE
jgi:hypothetical protein